ncbi:MULTISPECIES: hypothetical protein [unclassified Streptomyces]|uniref:hypothetical protein n=1 Tax=unclassified Streptomyces TaxID=2593676 RepID=UPI00380AA551
MSIGLTDDQGVDYYAVNRDMDMLAVESVPWTVDNVIPYLPARHSLSGAPLLTECRGPSGASSVA